MKLTTEIAEFTRVANDNVPTHPKLLTPEAVAFISKMVNDELTELKESKTILEQADALVDAIYYICDCAVKHGINLDPLIKIVHSANMRKLVDGKVIKREDGKIMKPEGWYPSDEELAKELATQESMGAFIGWEGQLL